MGIALAQPCRTPALEAAVHGSHIRGLDGIRGVSALLVLGSHLLLPRQYGALGVSIFFVLSGFLITLLLVREADATGTVSLKAFYLRRTLRIFPAFYVFWLVCLAAAPLRGAITPWPEAASAVFYLGDYYAATKYAWYAGAGASIMGITWSLGIEEKFYLIWPWMFRRYAGDPRRLLGLILACIGLVWAYRLVMSPLPLPRAYLQFAFESRLDNILYGCLLAVAVKTGAADKYQWLISRWRAGPLITAAALAASVYVSERLGPAYDYRLGMTLQSILITCLLAQAVALSGDPLWRWLEARPMRYSGHLSYSLYLYHATAAALVFWAWPGLRLRYSVPLAILASFAAAALSYHCVERPFLKLKERIGKTR